MTNLENNPVNNSERVDKPSYVAVSEDMIDLAAQRNPEQGLVLMREFLDTVYADANKGDIVTSRGDVIDGLDITDRFKNLVDKLNKPQGEQDPFSLLPRSGELRASFVKLLSAEATASPLMQALTERIYAAEKGGEKQLSSNEVHAIGGQAIESSQLVPIEANTEAIDPLMELNKGFNADEINNLRLYAELKQEQRDIYAAIRRGELINNPRASQDAAQDAARALKAMSPAARAVADRYDRLYNK